MPTNKPRITTNLDWQTYQWLEDVAQRRGISTAGLSAELIRQGLQREFPAMRPGMTDLQQHKSQKRQARRSDDYAFE